MNVLFKSVWGTYCIPQSVFIPSPNQWFIEHKFLKIQCEIVGVCVCVCVYGICVDRGSKKSVSSASSNLLKKLRTTDPGTSLVLEWIRIHLPMQGTHFWSLAQEIPHTLEQLSPCTATVEPMPSRTLEPQLLKPCAATAEAREPRACAPQQRSHCNEKPMYSKKE